jgi:N-acyl-phosphatidylethanolamine-hydrolysing phospholipase D
MRSGAETRASRRTFLPLSRGGQRARAEPGPSAAAVAPASVCASTSPVLAAPPEAAPEAARTSVGTQPGVWTRAAALAAQQRPQRFPRALARTFSQHYHSLGNNNAPDAPPPPAETAGAGALAPSAAGAAATSGSGADGHAVEERPRAYGDRSAPDPASRKIAPAAPTEGLAAVSQLATGREGQRAERSGRPSTALPRPRVPRHPGLLARAPTLPYVSTAPLFGRRASIAATSTSEAVAATDATTEWGDHARRIDSLPVRSRMPTISTDGIGANGVPGGVRASKHITLPDHHLPAGVGFRNPWPSAGRALYLPLLRPRGAGASAATGRALLKVARDRKPPDELLATMLLLSARPNFAEAARAVQKDKRALVCHWIGHATLLLHLPGLVILTDPVWSSRLGPLGPRRLVPPPCDISDLPETIHIVLLSSACYDHFDKHAIEKLIYRVQRWLVPLGLKPLLSSLGVDPANVTELDWWQTTVVGDTQIACTPSQHHSNHENSLWCSWRLEPPYRRIFYCGGTGYRAVSRSDDTQVTFNQRALVPAHVCPAFREVYQRYGSCDVAFLPIGSASPRQTMSPINADAVDMLFIHRDLHARQSVVHHWGTFQAGDEGMLDPVRSLEAALLDCPVSEHDVTYLKHGHLHNC